MVRPRQQMVLLTDNLQIPICALSGIIFAMFDHGLGRRAWTLEIEDLTIFLELLFSANYVFDLCICSTKACALLFYNRVFPPEANSRWFNWSLRTLHALNIGWLVGIVIATFFLCSPMESSYNPLRPGDCSNQVPVYIGSAVSSVAIDFFILLLPLPKIWALQMSMIKKGGLMLVFLLGYLYVYFLRWFP